MSNFVVSILVEAKDAASSVLGGVGDALSGLGKVGLAVAGAGVAALGGALVAAVGNAIDAQDVFAQTEAVVKSTGGAAGLSAQQMADLASSLSAAAGKSTWSDELILSGENVLATFTSIGKEVFPLATQSALDMAQALHSTPEAMSMLLGKALSSAQGVTALTRSGVRFNAEQLKTIKNLFATGHAAEAQKMILAEVANEFGGSAAAAAATFSGQLGTLKDKFGELLESIGAKILPILTQFVSFLNSPDIQAGVQALADVLVNGIGQAATWLGTTAIPALIGAWNSLQPVLSFVQTVLQAVADEFAILLGRDPGEWATGWLGTLQEIGALLSDSMGAGLQLVTGLFGQLSEAGGGVVEWMSRMRDVVHDNGFPLLGAALQSVAATFTDARNPVEGFLAVLAQISPTFALVKAGIDAALPPIQQIITSVFGIIGGFLQEHGAKIQSDVGGAWQQIQAIINAVIPPIQQIIATVFGAIAAFLQAHGAEIQAFMGQTWDSIAQIVHLALDLIQATVVPALQAIAGFISSHSAEIQSILNIAWGTIKTIITTVLGVIRGVLTAALAAIHGDWAGAWEAIKGVASTIWEGIKSLLQLNLQLITTLFKSTWDGIKAYFEQLLNGIVGYVIQTMLGIANAIRDFGSQAAGAAASVGGAIVSGIADGIKNGVGAIVEAAKSAARAAIDAAMHALDAHSPSKEFVKVGGYAGSGFAIGMTDSIPAVASAAAGMAGAALSSASSQVANSVARASTQGSHVGKRHAPDFGSALSAAGGMFSGAATRDAGLGGLSGGAGGGTTNSVTYNLNYTGVHQEETDVRHALRAQALLTGAIG